MVTAVSAFGAQDRAEASICLLSYHHGYVMVIFEKLTLGHEAEPQLCELLHIRRLSRRSYPSDQIILSTVNGEADIKRDTKQATAF